MTAHTFVDGGATDDRPIEPELLDSFDAALVSDPETPWYLPLRGETSSLLGLRRGRLGRRIARRTIGILETLGIAPKGTSDVHRMLVDVTYDLSAGGETGIFTPMHLVVCRKPAKK